MLTLVRRFYYVATYGFVAKKNQFYHRKIHLIVHVKWRDQSLKNISQIEHSRHLSFTNFLVSGPGVICAYQFKENKPSIYSVLIVTKQLFFA